MAEGWGEPAYEKRKKGEMTLSQEKKNLAAGFPLDPHTWQRMI